MVGCNAAVVLCGFAESRLGSRSGRWRVGGGLLLAGRGGSGRLARPCRSCRERSAGVRVQRHCEYVESYPLGMG
jgi:hypothetical protein